jgi:hypothetical protein
MLGVVGGGVAQYRQAAGSSPQECLSHERIPAIARRIDHQGRGGILAFLHDARGDGRTKPDRIKRRDLRLPGCSRWQRNPKAHNCK